MRNHGMRSGLTLLVSAAVLLAGINPPPVQHAHAAGDQPHGHHAPHDHHAPHAHHAPHDHHAHGRDAAKGTHAHHRHDPAGHRAENEHPGTDERRHQQVLEPRPIAHLHVRVLWLEFYLSGLDHPLSDTLPSSPADGAPVDLSLSLVRLALTEAVLANLQDAGQPLDVDATHSPVASSQPVLRTQTQGDRATLRSLPLCDSARLERSGVRLI